MMHRFAVCTVLTAAVFQISDVLQYNIAKEH